MMSICNTQKLQQYGNKQGDSATVTEKATSKSYLGNFNFFQTGKVITHPFSFLLPSMHHYVSM